MKKDKTVSNPWDERYSAEGFVYGTRPNAFLVEQAHRITPGARVLLPGDGEGRNGVWLAEEGMTVLSVDGSPVGLSKAKRLAAERGVSITTEVADLAVWDWPTARFDAVVSLFLHLAPAERAAIHARMVAALRPRGLLILEAFRPEQLAYSSGGPKDPALLYTADQMRADFRGTDILVLKEALTTFDEGELHRGPGATLRLVARKP
jgi:2-polyprenyl-3-methyl-5-hydroxy-6-metoxy-1,4-benzoquinol methylase